MNLFDIVTQRPLNEAPTDPAVCPYCGSTNTKVLGRSSTLLGFTGDVNPNHQKDIEVATKTYGWLETHSCTYFGEEQTKRFGITGLTHTISNTGLASPRILVPFLERAGIQF